MSIWSVGNFGRQEIKRLRDIAGVLSSYGFGEIFAHLPIPGKFILPEAQKEKISYSHPKRLRLALEELGTTFIKLGQFASTRPDIFPANYIEELSKLRDEVTPVSFDGIEELLKKEWGENWRDKFILFDDQPIASASIAQVYKGRLAEGAEVAVKIRRPGIDREIEADIRLIMFVARFLERRHSWSLVFQPVEIAEEFTRSLKRELDFKREALIINKFLYNHRSIEEVVIPEVIMDMSTEKVLVMNYIDGETLDRADFTEEEKKRVARLGVRVLISQILKDGLFHADPHPGNLLYTRDGKLSYLDFGMVGRLSLKMRNQLIDLIVAEYSSEPELILQELVTLGEVKEDIDRETLIREIMEISDRYINVAIKDISLGRALFDIFYLVKRNKILIHPAYTVVGKALIIGEETAKELDGQMNVMTVIYPHLKRLLIQRYSPRNIWLNFRLISRDMSRLVYDLPSQLRQIILKLKSGQLEIEFKHVGLEGLINTLERTSSRIAFSLIIAALIIGSSFVIQTTAGPAIMGISIFGLIGYISAAVLGIWLLWLIIRAGRM